MRTITFLCFGLLVAAQLYVPASMILGRENTIKAGKEFQFRVAPIDPNDPLRGKYIRLDYEDNFFPLTDVSEWKYGQQVYVALTEDEAGFAVIEKISDLPPTDTDLYVRGTIRSVWNSNRVGVSIRYPFNRYYMEESIAYPAERVFWEAVRDSSTVAYARVSVLKGDAVVQGVILDGETIEEQAREYLERE